MPEVDLLVNCYERTYRSVLAPGFFESIATQNHLDARRHALINNVVDRANAERRAHALLDAGEIDSFTFVSDVIDRARQVTRVPPRALRQHAYFLDYGLAMSATGSMPWIVGWDAEVTLERPADWIGPAIELMTRRPDIFSASPNWPRRGLAEGTLPKESFDRDGAFWLNWGFTDQAFLVRRAELAKPIYRRFAPASWARNAEHPWSFEARVESYQRASRRPRATLSEVRFAHNDIEEVVGRLGGRHGLETWQYRLLVGLRKVLPHWPSDSPRWRIL